MGDSRLSPETKVVKIRDRFHITAMQVITNSEIINYIVLYGDSTDLDFKRQLQSFSDIF